MSRKGKIGLNYFPFDVDFFNDEKIELISAKNGDISELVIIKLLSRIYRQGYFIHWDEDVSFLYAKKFGSDISQDLIKKTVDESLKQKLFSEKLFKKYSILTSRGIQYRFIEATKRRKKIDIVEEYLLIPIDDVHTVNDNVNILIQNTRNGTQSKVKESRVNYKETFKIFYADYPMKKGKQKAESSWLKHRPDLDTCLKAIELQKAERKALEGDGQFCPPWKYPVTWLNQGCWEDEVSIDTPKPPAAPWARQDNMR